MSAQISFDRASGFEITGGNFGKVGGDYTIMTLPRSDLVPSSRSHKHNRRRVSRSNGRGLREPVAETTLTRTPAPSTSTPRSSRSSVRPSNFRSPRDENGDNSTNYSSPRNGNNHQSHPGPRSPLSTHSRPPSEALSPLTDALGLRRFTPSHTSRTIASRDERRNTPHRAQPDAPESRTSTRSRATRSPGDPIERWHSPPFERPPNPSPSSFYSHGPPAARYPHHTTRSMNDTTNLSPRVHSSTMSSHDTTLLSWYSQPISPSRSVHSGLNTPGPSLYPVRQVPRSDLTPAEAVRAHWTALYTVHADTPHDVRHNDSSSPLIGSNNTGPAVFCFESNCQCRSYPYYPATYYEPVYSRHPSQSPSVPPVPSNRRPPHMSARYISQQQPLASPLRGPTDGYTYAMA